VGPHAVTFRAANSLNLSVSKTVAIEVMPSTPQITALVNAASYSAEAACSPGGMAALFGLGFTRTPGAGASVVPLATTSNGVRVKVNDVYAPLYFVSTRQVNFQCPALPAGTTLQVRLENQFDISNPVSTVMQEATPAIFTLDGSGQGQGAILIAGTSKVAMTRTAPVDSQPARPGDYIVIYAHGLGPVDNPVAPGQKALANPLSRVTSQLRVRVGEVFPEIAFAGLAPDFVGLYQINLQIPLDAPVGGAVPVTILVTDRTGRVAASNTVTIAIEP
jgi:uncharacterized protein (TIGR03437 family)